MISNNSIQAALITYLKANSSLLAKLSSSADIKESQWQGTDFIYPAVRIDLGTQVPEGNPLCNYSSLPITVQVFTEDASSLNCDTIAGIIGNILHGVNFHDTPNKVTFVRLTVIGLVGAIRRDNLTWYSEVSARALISP